MNFVPEGYFEHNLLFVHSQWICQLLEHQALPEEYQCHSEYTKEDVRAVLKDGKVPKNDIGTWEILEVERFVRHPDEQVCQLPALVKNRDSDPCFAEILQFVSQANFANIWREQFKKFSHTLINDSNGSKDNARTCQVTYDSTLLDIINRLYNCLIIDASDNSSDPLVPADEKNEDSNLKHVRSAIACIITPTEILVLKHHNKYNLQDLLRFSPAIIDNAYNKNLFIIYQVLIAFNEIHKKGLRVGDITLKDINIDQELFVSVCPIPQANLLGIDNETLATHPNSKENVKNYQKLLRNLKSQLVAAQVEQDLDQAEIICDNFLGHAVHLWSTGQLSNFDYILLLNYLSGRTFENPNHYPVMPWIRDFNSANGGWRDLTKSKYRLNKGDTQLELTYGESLLSKSNQEFEAWSDPLSQQKSVIHIPHHVSDVLSEITYYVYKARRTPKSVLCKYVRNRWVPAEYPQSMQRLMEWTPDECIPEFYTDPEIFCSIHEDLPDLELPSWCSNPQDFIQWHQECLESERVSEKLHAWIDLTFGYKLSGSSAVRAKNVCLNLVDNHLELRNAGVIQLFNSPHPTKVNLNDAFWDFKKAPNLAAYQNPKEDLENSDNEVAKVNLSDEPTMLTKTIALPKNYDPLGLMNENESLETFIAKSNSKKSDDKDKDEKKVSLSKVLQTRRMIRDMQVLGCLILELFLPKKFIPLGGGSSVDLKSRFALASSILEHELSSVPHCIRGILQVLLKHDDFQIDDTDRYPIINGNDGLPPPSAFQVLVSSMSPMQFPSCFDTFARILRVHQEIELSTLEAKRFQDKYTNEVEDRVCEVLVKTIASDLLPIMDELSASDLSILLPKLKHLYGNPNTAIMMAWLTFEPLAKVLGPKAALEHLLQPIVNIYENNAQTSKHLKLYHRTFLCNVMVRFSLRIFLKYFCQNLIEAVGGYKDFDDHQAAEIRTGLERHWTMTKEEPTVNNKTLSSPKSETKAKTPNEDFAEGEVFAFDNEESANEFRTGKNHLEKDLDHDTAKGTDIEVPSAHDVTTVTLLELLGSCDKIGKLSEGNISQVASESVIWLAHRCGPLLTATKLSKNLLKMLNLCYIGAKSSNLVMNEVIKQQDFIIRLQSGSKSQGDILAHNVLECLTEIASIYGENFILCQYLPYAWDLISLCKKRLSPNLEGGLTGCVTMIHHMIPYLNDAVLMNELIENFMNKLLFPVLQLVTSRSVTFSGGAKPRQVLLGKLLDVTYLIGLRIGEEMARSNLSPLSSAFFSAFDKVYDDSGKVLESQEEQDALKDLQQVLTPDFAYACYVAFYHLMGRAHLDLSIPNLRLIKVLCSRVSSNASSSFVVATFSHLRSSTTMTADSSASSGGNKILSSQESATRSAFNDPSQEIQNLIKKEMNSTSRHLKGHWLSYWENEIGRSDKDHQFNLKQIKLQTFQGHSAGVKSMFVLDNENSFLSGGRDKTVKVWSLRSQGDGTSSINPSWSYNMHKKSIFSVHFLDNINLAVSCDTTIHIWDPFVGTGVHQVDPTRLGPVTVMSVMKKPSTLVLAATQHDSLLHMIDCRLGNIVTDLKVCIGSAGLIRCISTEPDGNSVTIGHSSGFISQLDIRTGKLKQAWKAHEGEILTLTSLNSNEFVSTSLDQVVSVWNSSDGKIKCMLPGAQEPVHCVAVNEEGQQLITGSTGNRIAVRKGFSADSPFSSTKIKSDVLKGNLLSMKMLPLNRLLLLGEDSGKIRLIC